MKNLLIISVFFIFGCLSHRTAIADNAEIEVHSFEDCVKAGYPVMKSLPAQCSTPDGIVFFEPPPAAQIDLGQKGMEVCKDLCGDGICQEIVCMAVGCPCPETPESCPQDCK